MKIAIQSGVIVVALCALALLLPMESLAAAPSLTVPFDHATTGFLLDGAHRDLQCESCHINAVFNGTPRDCSSCHSRGTRYNALPKPTNHILSSDRCEACHNTTAYLPVVHFDHSDARGSCASCHNNVQAVGKSTTHISTAAGCETCHSSAAWRPAAFDHAGIVDNCFSCHNGARATGKNIGHLNTTNVCEACHQASSWQPWTRVDHAQVAGTCVSCHGGTQRTSVGPITARSANHIQSDDNCANCHTTVAWRPANFNHGNITGNCASCHNGTSATGKGFTHIPTNNSCESCHTVVAWRPVARVDHAQVADTCFGCHNNTLVISTGSVVGKSATHIASGNDCETCHTTVAFRPATFNHAAVTGNCFSCHNGTSATGKSTSHMATTNMCEACHNSTIWRPAVRVDHAQVTGTCLSCHNNGLTISTGTVAGKNVTHVTSDDSCQNCHSTAAWRPANFQHNGITGNCFSCHNGTAARGKNAATHIASTNNCETCHGVVVWTPAIPVDHSQVTGTCLSCHNNTLVISTGTVAGKTPTHIASGNDCETCHSTIAWRPAHGFDHAGVTSGCFGCHDGTRSIGKSATHMATSNLCENCHTTSAFAPARTTDHSQVSGTCVSCHSGALNISTGVVPGKPANHIATTNSCQNCHTTNAFIPATADHTQIPLSQQGSCNTCHNSVLASPKPNNHIQTTAECGGCHTTLAWRPATFNHAGITTGCAACHDGVRATGKQDAPSPHFVTARDCNFCHTTVAWSPTTRYIHVSPNYPGDHRTALNCTNSSCHGGNSETVTWRNAAYANSCAGCHAGDYETGPHTKYGNVKYTVSELRNCSGACHVYTDATLTTIRTRRNGPEHRVTASGF